jgi:hypothetical protein
MSNEDPLAIDSETKDWTWVLERACPDCGLDTAAVDPAEVPAMVRIMAANWTAVLSGDPDELRERPAPTTWSALEYGCHVRDVCRTMTERVGLLLAEDDPVFANWDQDETALTERYWEQDPAVVAVELVEAAEVAALAFERVGGGQWDRPGRRSNGSRFTVATLAQYFIHDPLHHLHDVTGTRAA